MWALSKLAVVCILIGAILLAGPIFGFSTIGAERTTSVSTADDSTALVGLTSLSGEITSQNDEADAVRVSNNLDEAISLQTNQEDLTALQVSDDFDTSLDSGNETELTLECGDSASGAGTETFTTVITKAATTSGGVTVESASIEASIEYDCGGPDGGGNFEVDNPSMGDDPDQLEFDLKNVGSDGEKIKRISLDSTTSDAIQVDNRGKNNPEIVLANGNVDENGAIPIDGTNQNINVKTIDPGETVAVEIQRFQDGDGGAVDLEGNDVDISLYREGGNVIQQLTVSVPVFPSGGEDVDTDGDIVVETDEEAGDIEAGGDLIAEDGSAIKGSIDVDGEVDLGDQTEAGTADVGDTVTAGGDITTGDGSSLKNDVISKNGDVLAGSDSKIDGNADGDDVEIGSGGEVVEDVIADGDVVLRADAVVKGDVIAGGCVTVENGAEVKGTIEEDENCDSTN